MCGRVCLRILLLGCYVKFGSADFQSARSDRFSENKNSEVGRLRRAGEAIFLVYS